MIPRDKQVTTATLLVTCEDQSGLVAAMTSFVADQGGNIEHLDQHVDEQSDTFFMRIEWTCEADVKRDQVTVELEQLTASFGMTTSFHFSDEPHRIALFVSKEAHCLYDLLSRTSTNELNAEVACIVSNHTRLQHVAKQFDVPFHHIPISPETKPEQEKTTVALLTELEVDTIVLARYMQILSPTLIDAFPNQIINIHHSFLPAFQGAKPYHAAYRRGVKIIGATSHYVTTELDEGPIIEQDVIHISHRESVRDMIRMGKDLEKTVLARAVWAHIQRKVIVYNNKTVVF